MEEGQNNWDKRSDQSCELECPFSSQTTNIDVISGIQDVQKILEIHGCRDSVSKNTFAEDVDYLHSNSTSMLETFKTSCSNVSSSVDNQRPIFSPASRRKLLNEIMSKFTTAIIDIRAHLDSKKTHLTSTEVGEIVSELRKRLIKFDLNFRELECSLSSIDSCQTSPNDSSIRGVTQTIRLNTTRNSVKKSRKIAVPIKETVTSKKRQALNIAIQQRLKSSENLNRPDWDSSLCIQNFRGYGSQNSMDLTRAKSPLACNALHSKRENLRESRLRQDSKISSNRSFKSRNLIFDSFYSLNENASFLKKTSRSSEIESRGFCVGETKLSTNQSVKRERVSSVGSGDIFSCHQASKSQQNPRLSYSRGRESRMTQRLPAKIGTGQDKSSSCQNSVDSISSCVPAAVSADQDFLLECFDQLSDNDLQHKLFPVTCQLLNEKSALLGKCESLNAPPVTTARGVLGMPSNEPSEQILEIDEPSRSERSAPPVNFDRGIVRFHKPYSLIKTSQTVAGNQKKDHEYNSKGDHKDVWSATRISSMGNSHGDEAHAAAVMATSCATDALSIQPSFEVTSGRSSSSESGSDYETPNETDVDFI